MAVSLAVYAWIDFGFFAEKSGGCNRTPLFHSVGGVGRPVSWFHALPLIGYA